MEGRLGSLLGQNSQAHPSAPGAETGEEQGARDLSLPNQGFKGLAKSLPGHDPSLPSTPSLPEQSL